MDSIREWKLDEDGRLGELSTKLQAGPSSRNWSPRRSSPAITHRFARFRADWLWLASNWAPIIRSILAISFDPSGIHPFPTINLLIDSRSQWVDCDLWSDRIGILLHFFIVIIISRCEMILIGYRLNEESTVLLFVSGRRDHSRG